jgi:beta-lactamase superfamily II metal-dependent hydrolase
MLLGGLAMLLGLIWPPLGQIAAWLTWPLTAYTLAFVDVFAQVPGGTLALGEVAPAAVLLFYAALFGLTWVLTRPADQRPAWWAPFARESLPAGGAGLLALATLLAWSTAFSWPEAPTRLQVTVLETGPAPAVLIQTPAGGAVLVDGGRSGGALTRGLARHLPLFQTRLDLLVMAGLGEEAAGGLPDLLDRYTIQRALLTGAPPSGAAQAAALQALTASPAVERVSAAEKPGFNFGDGLRLQVLADGPRGSALRLEWGRFSLVIPGKVNFEQDPRALAEAWPATAVVLPGRDTPAAELLLQALDPAVVVLAGGPPAPEMAGALAGRLVLRTDERGAISLLTDGERLWVETAR